MDIFMASTIYDVAQHAGVAISTVSKVLSGKYYVSGKTRTRVLTAIKELNFVPSSAARSLAGDLTSLIGIVISYDPEFIFDDPALLQMLTGVDSEVNQHDCALLLSTPVSKEDRLSAYKRFLRGFKVDGILVESGLGEEGVALLADQGYHVVVIGYSEYGYPCIHPDDYTGALWMTRYLIELGHRRIGVIAGPVNHNRAPLARKQGYSSALKEAGITQDESLIIPGDYRPESGYSGAAYLMQKQNPPTAIFAFNDRMAFGAMNWLKENHYSIPGDVSIAGFDNVPAAQQTDPPLTTIGYSFREIGRRGARMLFQAIRQEAGIPKEIVLPVEFMQRASTGPVKSRR
jgi:LacI family transcriptional regulator, repressor for deo operon, udp, cdd, tsx, nupC, and nupG